MKKYGVFSGLVVCLSLACAAAGNPGQSAPFSSDANRLLYLEEQDPFHVGLHFPKLTTPQWVGEPGVELVVTFGIDDMSGHQKYEEFLRPILERLKKIDGRAPVSIFSNAPDPEEGHLQTWLQEGVSIEAHTLNHPCPILAQRNFAAAGATYHGCVDLLSQIPNGGAVAFRTPCCDSINSASPRLFAELMCGRSPQGSFVSMDSSVVVLLTTNDVSLPAAELIDKAGRPRFQKYVPFPSFKTTIENYPFPYVVNNLVWEMPFPAPSDWQAQNILGSKSPEMLEDWKKAMDLILRKKGVMNLVLHPHGWSGSDQFVALIDHAETAHPRRVKFLNFKEAHERLVRNLLAGQPLRTASGGDNGVRLLDINNDGYLDVVIANASVQRTRIWDPLLNKWNDSGFPVSLVRDGEGGDAGIRFGIVRKSGAVSVMVANEKKRGAWTFEDERWMEDPEVLAGLDANEVFFSRSGIDVGARLRDIDADGVAELIISNPKMNRVFHWSDGSKGWLPAEFALPQGVSIVKAEGLDNGVRFVDLNADGFDDLLFSNEERYGLWLYVREPFLGFAKGWTRKVTEGSRLDADAIPPFVRAGTNRNNGAWFHSRSLWVQNEDTAHLPDLVERRSFDELLVGVMPAPKSPEESRSCIQVRPGLKVELVVSEPLIEDPVAFDWDAKGQLWVVEMRDYPMGMDGNGKPGGVVKLLRDSDGDGSFDTATEFLAGLNFPTGVMPWRGGVLISAAPDILYAEDTNGDGLADLKKVLVTGFGEGNQQHRFNGFVLGLDGWVYGANGDSGGTLRVISSVTGAAVVTTSPVELRSGDFRFKPDAGELEVIEGPTQYGRYRDDWGNWFGNGNYTWLWQYHFPAHYLRRNPYLAVRTMKTMLADYPGAGRVYAVSRALQRPNAVGADGHVTSANSPVPYRDDLFGEEFGRTIFISEPSENLVHREVLFSGESPMYGSRRAEEEQKSEFIASTDNYFRPIQTKTGPDGALYIADMYRGTIEHPEWIPQDLQARMNIRAGEGMGRIYRVVPEGKPLRRIPKMHDLTGADLSASMESANGWQRDTAMRLLIERRDASAIGGLKRIAQESALPKARVQALCTLDLLEALSADVLRAALSDENHAVRRHAVRFSEPRLQKASVNDALIEAVLMQVEGADAELALQLALSLGELRNPKAALALVSIAMKYSEVEVIQNAVLSSSLPHCREMIVALGNHPSVDAASPMLLENLFKIAIESRDKEAMRASLELVLRLNAEKNAAVQFRIASSLVAAAQGSAGDRNESAAIAKQLDPIFQRARHTALHGKTAGERLTALRALTFGQEETAKSIEEVAGMLGPHETAEIQRAALGVLKRSTHRKAGAVLLSRWDGLSPSLRPLVLDVLLASPERTSALLDALEAGSLSVRDFNPAARQQLLQQGREDLRERAARVFAAVRTDREAILRDYASVKVLAGDTERGRTQFSFNCASCHRLQDAGYPVGPDLATMGDRSVPALLVAILDPNRTVIDQYLNYTVTTREGRAFSGMIAGETPNSITLKNANGVDEVLLRSQLKEVRSTHRSLMPEGFEHSLDQQQMADLIAFIAAAGTPPKAFEGNEPGTVSATADGVIRLEASTAEIYGASLVFENQFRNLGYWQSENDRAIWNFIADRAGDYEVVINAARPGQDQKHRFRIEIEDTAIEQPVRATGSWENYRKQSLGTIRLGAGRHRLMARGTPPVQEPIVDLRSILLIPVAKPE